QPVCSASAREPPEAAEPLYPRGGRDERHPVSEEAARRGQGGLSEDRAGQREAAGSALEAPEPGAEAPRADGGEAPLRSRLQRDGRAGAQDLAGRACSRGPRCRSADRDHRPRITGRPRLARHGQAPPHRPREAHQGGGAGDLAEDRACLEQGEARAGGRTNGGHDARRGPRAGEEARIGRLSGVESRETWSEAVPSSSSPSAPRPPAAAPPPPPPAPPP